MASNFLLAKKTGGIDEAEAEEFMKWLKEREVNNLLKMMTQTPL